MYLTNKFNGLRNDRAFLSKLLAIGLPIALQQLLNTVLNFVDTLMIGQLGESTIAAVGLANKVFFVFNIIVFGICSGTSILTAQYWGKGDVRSIHRAQGLALTLSVSISLVFLAVCAADPLFVMRIFTNSESAAVIGAGYLKYVVWSYPLTAITMVYVASLRSVNQVKAPVIISIISILVNVLFNWLLIFGVAGFPRLEAEGAAIATAIARTVECISLLLIVYKGRSPVAGSLKEMLSFSKPFSRLFFTTASPVIFNEMTWGIGVTMYSLAYGRMGDDAVAAITVTQSIEQIAQVFFMGLASACAVILGNELGAGKMERARKHGSDVMFLQWVFSFVIALVFFALRGPIISLFSVSDTVIGYANACMTVFCLYVPFKNFNLINVVGILRSGGDSRFAFLMDLSSVWLIGVPLAFLGALVWHVPIYIVYALVLSEEAFKVIIGTIRYKQRKWCRNLVADPAQAQPSES